MEVQATEIQLAACQITSCNPSLLGKLCLGLFWLDRLAILQGRYPSLLLGRDIISTSLIWQVKVCEMYLVGLFAGGVALFELQEEAVTCYAAPPCS